ncbi:transcription factor A, mitochondrial [Anopheles bellator]|uniref:transcription factor A, mitochondrial n=1 Tax=Anopheles bellator TaxID=139047 RepID=UPI00264857CE|nr:transcription factor A, mitochondrial [Anopheles bellator]
MQLNSLIKLFNSTRLLVSTGQTSPFAVVATQSRGLNRTASLNDATSKGAPEKPKRPANAYIRYMQSIRSALASANPGTSPSDISKLAALKWQALDVSEKTKHEEAYKRELAVWLQKNAKYLSQLTDADKEQLKHERQQKAEDKAKREHRRMLKQLGRPKRPVNGFLRFSAQNKSKTGMPREERMLLMKDLGQKWRNLPSSEKERYNREAQEDLVRYEKEMKLWEDKMLSTNNTDVVRRKNVLVEPSKTKKQPTGPGARP